MLTPLLLLLAALTCNAGNNLTRAEAEARAATLWAAHCAEVAADTVAPLPAPAPFDSVSPCVWHLPDSLEADADMLFALACEGSRPDGGRPLYIYLHGSGPRNAEWSTGRILTRRWAAETGPSAWFVPRIPREGEYYRWWQRAKLWTWERLLRRALASDEFDPKRIYLLGISEGGYGSQRLASFYADYLAAAGPMAGGEPLANNPTDNLRNTPFSLLTGSEDRMFCRNILTARAAEELDSLSALWPGDYIHRVELQQGRGHGIDYSPTAPWLSRHTRRRSPRHITWEDFGLDGCRRRAFANIEPLERPDSIDRIRYDLRIDSLTNTLTLTVDAVTYTPTEKDPVWGIALRNERTFRPIDSGSVRIYLDDTMLDLDRPISVSVNGRQLPPIRAARSEATLRRAIDLWADPLRLYPASLTLRW